MKLFRIIPSKFQSSWKRKKTRIRSNAEWRFWLASIPLAWMLVFFVLPILIIMKISFSQTTFEMPPFSGIFEFTKDCILEIKLNLSNYINIFKDSYYLVAFMNSLILSTITTIVCFLIGFPMAYGIFNAKERLKTILLLLVALSFWSSMLIRIYSWMNLLSLNGFINNLLIKLHIISSPIQFVGNYAAVCVGMIFCYLPFMIFPVYAVLEKVDRSFIESAYDLGCRPKRTFWKITVPLTKQGIFSGSLLVFTTTIGEFVIPELLGGPETITFGRVLWNEFFTNLDWPMACALSIIIMAFVILPIFILQRRIKF